MQITDEVAGSIRSDASFDNIDLNVKSKMPDGEDRLGQTMKDLNERGSNGEYDTLSLQFAPQLT